jgi:glycosyltransferase involved in cell wall biosynthesis
VAHELPSPGIAALLPYPEHFGPAHAGAIALKVRDEARASQFASAIQVYGRPIKLPFTDVFYQGLKPVWRRLLGRNRGLAERLRRELRGRDDVLIELHNRPLLVGFLRLRGWRGPLVLHLHNDPQSMRGAKTVRQRARLLERTAAIVCVSGWVRARFLEGLGAGHEQVHVVRNAIPLPPAPSAKEPLILFVGRLVPEKGVLELVRALERVLPGHAGWRAELIGPTRFGRAGEVTRYQQDVLAACETLGPAVRHIDFLPNDVVLERFAAAAVVVVPSRWPEPLSRTALEGLAHGCAVIASARGGLPEVVEGRGLLVEPTTEAIAETLDRVLTDGALRQDLQQTARADYPFTPEATIATLDALRTPLLARLSP